MSQDLFVSVFKLNIARLINLNNAIFKLIKGFRMTFFSFSFPLAL